MMLLLRVKNGVHMNHCDIFNTGIILGFVVKYFELTWMSFSYLETMIWIQQALGYIL